MSISSKPIRPPYNFIATPESLDSIGVAAPDAIVELGDGIFAVGSLMYPHKNLRQLALEGTK